MATPPKATKRIYVSYSHLDQKWLKEMEEEWSAVLLSERGFELFYDKRSLRPSDDVWESLQAGIESADVAVLLVTQHYLASDTITRWELPRLMEARKGTLKIFWILISDCAWNDTPLAHIQAANDVKRSLDRLRKPDRARVWQEIGNAILEATGAGDFDGPSLPHAFELDVAIRYSQSDLEVGWVRDLYGLLVSRLEVILGRTARVTVSPSDTAGLEKCAVVLALVGSAYEQSLEYSRLLHDTDPARIVVGALQPSSSASRIARVPLYEATGKASLRILSGPALVNAVDKLIRLIVGLLKRLDGTPRPASFSVPTGADRLRYAYLAALDRPELFELLDHFDETQMRAAIERAGGDVTAVLANLEKNHPGSEPNALWRAWVETVHPDKLGGSAQ